MTRVLLGMLARADRSREPHMDKILSIVGPCFDGIEIVDDGGKPVTDFAAQRNKLIDAGEAQGYDWMFMLDSDEAMMPADIEHVKSLMTPDNRFIVLPRYEFVKDFDHYDPQGYPDHQGRVFRLGVGYRFRRKVHEGLYRWYSPLSEMRLKTGVYSDSTPIFHYGRVLPAEVMLLKLHNYDRIKQGLEPIDELPEDEKVRIGDGTWLWGQIAPFEQPHPLRDL